MIVVCDATPLIHLSAIGRLALLQDLFGAVAIPEEVYTEVVTQGAGRPGAEEVCDAAWIHRLAVANRGALEALQAVLGAGEAASILLAAQANADLLVLDDRGARMHAKGLGLNVTGTLGVLLAATEGENLDFEHELGLLTASGFRLSDADRRSILDLSRRKAGPGRP